MFSVLQPSSEATSFTVVTSITTCILMTFKSIPLAQASLLNSRRAFLADCVLDFSACMPYSTSNSAWSNQTDYNSSQTHSFSCIPCLGEWHHYLISSISQKPQYVPSFLPLICPSPTPAKALSPSHLRISPSSQALAFSSVHYFSSCLRRSPSIRPVPVGSL